MYNEENIKVEVSLLRWVWENLPFCGRNWLKPDEPKDTLSWAE